MRKSTGKRKRAQKINKDKKKNKIQNSSLKVDLDLDLHLTSSLFCLVSRFPALRPAGLSMEVHQGLKRRYPFGASSEPLRKSHLSDKENLWRNPDAVRQVQQETVRRLFAASSSTAASLTTPAAAADRSPAVAAAGTVPLAPSNGPQASRSRRVTFAQFLTASRESTAKKYGGSPPPPSASHRLEPTAAAAASPAKGCSSCLVRNPVISARCHLCCGSVCAQCHGRCGRCGRDVCGNCGFAGSTGDIEERLAGGELVMCGDCNSIME